MRGTDREYSPLPPRQTSDDIAGQLVDIRRAHRLKVNVRLLLFFSAIVSFGARAFKDVQFKSGESNLVKTQRFGAISQLIFQIGTRPVQNRHEVIAHGINTAGRQIADALLIVGNPLLILPAVSFDILVHRDTLNNRPAQAFFRQ